MDSHHSMLLLLIGFLFVHGPHSLKAMLLPIQDTHLSENTKIYVSIVVSAIYLAPSILGALSLGEWAVTHSLEDSCF